MNQTVRLISWNVAGRVRKLAAQASVLSEHTPDILALQEVTRRTRDEWRHRVQTHLGLPHITDSFERSCDHSILTGPRRLGLLIASRYPIREETATTFEIPWPERILSAMILLPHGALEMHTTHIPPGASNGRIKVATLEGLAQGLARRHQGHRLLCGDFNLPQLEPVGDPVVYWDMRRQPDGSFRRVRDSRWGNAERAVHEGLAEYDLHDAWMSVHGRVLPDAFSWIPNHGHRRTPRRFDHLYASSSLRVSNVKYVHEPRESGLSDHSLLLAEMSPALLSIDSRDP